ncbi:hypothetical protein [Pontibacter litorisediminis]|uniref:hypothetical protein n=1 Tax=Pontibacter litorisediminis TaxID=1846260 RepID=UPI0023EE269E|nr:hypothetical protein [Pontibacter litorisediminis]
MDDFKIIIYILAAVAYFLLTQWRKAFKGGEDEDVDVESRRPRQQTSTPVTSFEDILRELQPKMNEARRKGQEVVQQAKERTREQVQPLMPPVAETAPKYRSYENISPKVLSWEKKAEAIEAAKQAKLRRQDVFKPYAQQHPINTSRYAEMLRNPASAREAIILTEIFNRKYN